MTYQFEHVGWLIDEGTEHERLQLGSEWKIHKMGMSNKLVVTLLDAQNSVALAVAAERARFDGLLLAVKDMLGNTCLSEARFAAESRALSEYKRLSGSNVKVNRHGTA